MRGLRFTKAIELLDAGCLLRGTYLVREYNVLDKSYYPVLCLVYKSNGRYVVYYKHRGKFKTRRKLSESDFINLGTNEKRLRHLTLLEISWNKKSLASIYQKIKEAHHVKRTLSSYYR